MKRLLLSAALALLAAMFLAAIPCCAQLPTYAANGHSCAFGGPHAATGLKCPLPNPSGANNAIVVGFAYDSNQNGTAGTTDDKSNTYTKAGTFNDSSNTKNIDIWVACGATAGATQVEPLLTGNATATVVTDAIVAEFYNVATSSCIDNGTFQGNAGAGSSVTTASTTPGASGELLVLFAFSDSGNATGWTIGSQSNITWMLLAAQADTGARVPGLAFQYGVYSSTAVISPTMSTTGGAGWIAASVFLKAANAGTAPPTGKVRVLFDQGVDGNSLAAGSNVIRWPHYGNTPTIFSIDGGGTFTTTTPTDSCSDSWSQAINSPFAGGGGATGDQVFFAKNASACDGTITMVFSGANQSIDMHFYDVDGADPTTPVCDSNGTGRVETAFGSQNVGGNLADAPDITPCRANGVVIAQIDIGTGGATGVTSTNGVFDSCVPRPYEPLTECDENNGWAVLNNTSTSAIPWTWTFEQAGTGIQGWGAMSLAIQPPADGTATKLAFTMQPSNVAAGAPITPAAQVSVEDTQGNVVTTATNAVAIAIGTSPPGGTLAGTTTVDAVNGVATFSNLSINKAGTGYMLAASATGLTGATSNAFNVTAGTAANVAATAGTTQTTPINTAFATNLQVTVTDANGNGVSGVSVAFTVNAAANGAGGAFTGGNTATTNAQGIASANTFTANGTIGTYTVTASASGISGTALFTLTNLSGLAASITAVSGTPQSAQSNTAFAALKALVKDGGGSPLSNVTVTFTAPTTGASGTFTGGSNIATANTDASGTATAPTFTANFTNGTYTVNATVSGAATPAAFALTETAGVPSVTNFSPSSATVGGAAFALTVNGGNFVTTSVVNFNGVAKTTTFVSDKQLTAAITAADIAMAGTVNVFVTTPAPGGGTTTAQTFTVNIPVPTLTSITPTSGVLGQAINLALTGSNFIAGSVVNFGVNADTGGAASNGGNTLVIPIPAAQLNAAGPVSVSVKNLTPGGGSSAAVQFTVQNVQPVIGSLSPSAATAGSAAFTLTITGNGFVSGATVDFGADKGLKPASTTATQIQVTVPATDIATGGTANVIVNNPAPAVASSVVATFNINNPLPTLASLGQLHSAGGFAFTLTVNGTNFVATSQIKFNGKAELTTFVSTTQLSAAIPAADVSTGGAVPVTVTNPNPGGGTTAPFNFIVDDFAVSGPTNPVTVIAGQAAPFTITVQPGANGFAGQISFSAATAPPATALPGGTAVTFAPANVTPNGSTVTTTMTITTTARGTMPPLSSDRRPPGMPQPFALFRMTSAILALAWLWMMGYGAPPRRPRKVVPALVLLLGVIIAGCVAISPNTPTGTPAGMTNIVVTSRAGTLSHETTVTLTVK